MDTLQTRREPVTSNALPGNISIPDSRVSEAWINPVEAPQLRAPGAVGRRLRWQREFLAAGQRGHLMLARTRVNTCADRLAGSSGLL
jgi:hypothetical protein